MQSVLLTNNIGKYTMSTKKAFVPLIELLEANKDKKVSEILDQAKALTDAKTGGGGRSADNVLRNDKGEVTHIFCYYHKMWESVTDVEFGKKASSPTGLSNMCKEGTASWTKQQRDAKTARDKLLKDVAAGEVKPSEIGTRTEEIEKARQEIIPRKDKKGTKNKPKTA